MNASGKPEDTIPFYELRSWLVSWLKH